MKSHPTKISIKAIRQRNSPRDESSKHEILKKFNPAYLEIYKARLSAEERAFAKFIAHSIDQDLYINRYADVKSEGIHPVIHWLEHGIFERRTLNPYLIVRLDVKPPPNQGLDWREFKWKNRAIFVRKSAVGIAFILEQIPDTTFDDEVLIEALLSRVDWVKYIKQNDDVAASKIDPVIHWLSHGFLESRDLGQNVIVGGDASEKLLTSESWDVHHWRGTLVAVRNLQQELSTVLNQFDNIDKDEVLFVKYVVENIDRKFYMQTNEDVRGSSTDPLIHFLMHGIREGRPPNPFLRVQFDSDQRHIEDSKRQTFRWLGKKVSVYRRDQQVLRFYNEINGFSPKDEDFASFVVDNLDEEMYAFRYADVNNSGHDPVSHYLKHGIYEGRSIAPDLYIRPCVFDPAEDDSSRLIMHWQGQNYEVRRNVIPKSIIDQVIRQAEFEPSVFASGANALPNLRVFDGPDLMDRDRVDVDGLLQAFDGYGAIILIIPYLLAGGAEKYTADLVSVLLKERGTNITVLVTEQTGEDQSWRQLSILSPIQKANVVFWRDLCQSFDGITTLARLLNALRPDLIVVVNSRIGLDVVASYGRGLSQFSRIYCAYFSLGIRGLGVPYGVMFPRLTSPFATSLTDNDPMRKMLEDRYALISKAMPVLLPAQVKIATRREFARRLEKRKLIQRENHDRKRWIWFSRIEVFKGTAILSALAKIRPDDQFDVYGPGASQIQSLGLDLANIHYKGPVSNVNSIDFSLYSGFTFTSLFEGMPNTVLEVAQHAIPIIATNVGGLRDTFRDTSLMFVNMNEDIDSMTATFNEYLDTIASSEDNLITRMVSNAYADVIDHHSPSVYHDNVKRLILDA